MILMQNFQSNSEGGETLVLSQKAHFWKVEDSVDQVELCFFKKK